MDERKLYDIDEVAAYFRVHPMTIRDWIKRGIIRGFRAGKSWRFTEAQVEAGQNRLQKITDEKLGELLEEEETLSV